MPLVVLCRARSLNSSSRRPRAQRYGPLTSTATGRQTKTIKKEATIPVRVTGNNCTGINIELNQNLVEVFCNIDVSRSISKDVKF